MRVRFRFSKLGKIRFTSQRDVARMWERALRRARLPLAYTEGFSPRPQLSFGLALPTGGESLAEYLDVVLDDDRPETAAVEVSALPGQLTDLLPDGIDVEEAVVVEDRAVSLQQQVTSCSWTMTFRGMSRATLEARVDALLAASEVMIERERKGRTEQDDLRPSVLDLTVVDPDPDSAVPSDGTVDVLATLATQPRGVRPVELVRGLVAVGPVAPAGDVVAADGVVAAVTAERRVGMGGAVADIGGGAPELVRACRTQQWIERDGARREPLEGRGAPLAAERARHALERAS